MPMSFGVDYAIFAYIVIRSERRSLYIKDCHSLTCLFSSVPGMGHLRPSRCCWIITPIIPGWGWWEMESHNIWRATSAPCLTYTQICQLRITCYASNLSTKAYATYNKFIESFKVPQDLFFLWQTSCKKIRTTLVKQSKVLSSILFSTEAKRQSQEIMSAVIRKGT